MYQIPQNKAVSDLTYNQQKMLGIVLKLPQKPFRTTDILTYSRSFADNSSSGAIIGSLARIGYIHKLAGGRNK
ncbi:MAG: hypothetical protein ABIP54_01195, partial [Candidatus Andersenbacteria bacterium]